MKIDCSFWYTNHVQWDTNHVKEKVKSTITADSKVVAQADELNAFTKRDTNCSYWKENNNLITACKPLSWNFIHVRPLSDVEFLMCAEHLFKSMTVIK